MALEPGVLIGFLVIFLAVLLGPFKIHVIEENLEVFLFVCGIAAMTISGFVEIPGTETGWRMEIIEEALTSPLASLHIGGIPIGIFQIVLIVGLIIFKWHEPIHKAIRKMASALSLKIMAFILIAVLGLFSSVMSAILAAIMLRWLMSTVPAPRSCSPNGTRSARWVTVRPLPPQPCRRPGPSPGFSVLTPCPDRGLRDQDADDRHLPAGRPESASSSCRVPRFLRWPVRPSRAPGVATVRPVALRSQAGRLSARLPASRPRPASRSLPAAPSSATPVCRRPRTPAV